MLGEFAHFSLILASLMALLQCIFAVMSVKESCAETGLLTRRCSYLYAGLIALSFILLMIAFIQNDFSILYVASHSSRSLPFFYRATAVWGAHEGSMFLWVLMLAVWTAIVSYYSQSLPLNIQQRMLSVLGCISFMLCLFILFTSNPFLRLLPNVPVDGRDLNPLLQDPGFVFHPPMLYIGYVGSAVLFAFAIACLSAGELKSAWAKWAIPFALMTWCFLTLGITLGSWWAYRELGWGGWWFWDPVENASFMPWLIMTALLHSLIVTSQRDNFKAWTCLLAIIAFSLSLLGTFLVRSGVLTSVHAFAVDPARGLFILLLLMIQIGGALTLFAARAGRLSDAAPFTLFSRETFILFNTGFLLVAMLTVCLGTLYPLIIDGLGLGKLSIGPPYFNLVFVPLFLPVMILVGIGPHTVWQTITGTALWRRVQFSVVISFILFISLMLFCSDTLPWQVSLAIAIAAWIVLSHAQFIVRVILENNLQQLPIRQWGMLCAHIGLAVTLIGIVCSSYLSIDRNVRFTMGAQQHLGPYQIQFEKILGEKGPNFEGMAARFQIYKNGEFVDTVDSHKRLYTVTQMGMTHAGIDASLWRDIYIAVGDQIDDKVFGVRLYYKPFVRWIWAGGLLMLLGGLLAASDRVRYYVKKH